MKPRVSSRFLEGLLYGLTAFGLFAFGGVEPWSRAILEASAFALALACALKGPVEVPPAAEWFWLFPAAFAAYGYVQLQSFVPADGPRPPGPFTAAPAATRGAIVLWLAYAALVWSVPRVIRSHEAARRYVRVVFGLGVLLAAAGLLQMAAGSELLYGVRDAGGAFPFGPYYNRDHAANVLLMSAALGAGLFLSKAGKIQGSRTRTAAALGVLLLLAGVAASGSRGALMAALLSAAAVALFGADFETNPSERRAQAAFALCGAAAVILVAIQYASSTADAGALVERSVMGRLSIYGDAWRWWRDSPLFGTGLGSFETVYPSYQDLELRAFVSHAHCDWLETLLEAGALGLLAALAAAATAAFASIRAWRSARSSEMRALIGGALAAAAAFAAHSLVDFIFQIPGNAFLLAGLVGFLLSAPAWSDKNAPAERAKPPRAAAVVLAAAAFLLAARAAVTPAAAAWLAAGPGDAAARAAALSRAYALEPDPAYLKDLAALLLRNDDAGGAGTQARRAGLGFAVAAASSRPFDSAVLELAGRSLWRLGRVADGRALLADAAAVRFPSYKPAGWDPAADALAHRKRLEALRALAEDKP
jgi:O-antigen ligase